MANPKGAAPQFPDASGIGKYERNRRLMREKLRAEGFTEGIHYYFFKDKPLALKEDKDRVCPSCSPKRKLPVKRFHNILHKLCRTCERRSPERHAWKINLEDSAELPQKQNISHVTSAGPVSANGLTGEVRAGLPSTREIIERELARRRLLRFVQRHQAGYLAGWVHEDICRRLERFSKAVAAGESPRLALFMPPRHGKSILASQHFPAWHLGQYPTHEVIAASYNISLPVGFSRRIRETVRDPAYTALFPMCKLSDESQAVEAWRTTEGGGYCAAGVGTGITGKGAHCVVPYNTINTTHGIIPIDLIKPGSFVYGYDHTTGKVVETRVRAISVSRTHERIVQRGSLAVTASHRVFVPEVGYVEAGAAQDMSGLWWKEGAAFDPVPYLSQGWCARAGQAAVHLVRRAIHALRSRGSEAGVQERRGQHVLQPGLLQRVAGSGAARAQGSGFLCDVQQALGGWGPEEVLLTRVLSSAAYRGRQAARILGQVLGFARLDCATGRSDLSVLWEEIGADGGASHRPQRGEPRPVQPRAAVSEVSCLVSQSPGDFARRLGRGLQGSGRLVVDIQTDTGNFFAENQLIHNCLIVDDPIKDQEAADSQVVRDSTWEWYLSTAYTRVAPGGGILVIQTRWHDDDFSGRIIAAMESGDGEKFEIVSYPAINEGYTEAISASDEIIKVMPGEEVPAGARVTRQPGEALHPARYALDALLRIKNNFIAAGMRRMWSALYQQNPVPDEGAFFTKDMLKYSPNPPPRETMTLFQAWDFSITEKETSDWIVGVCWGLDANDHAHELDMVRFKVDEDAYILADQMIDFFVKWQPYKVGVEDGQIWKSVSAVVLREAQKRRVAFNYEALKPFSDKLVRAGPLRGRMQLGRVWFRANAAWRDEMDKEMLRFPSGVHDDMCLAGGTSISMADGTTKRLASIAPGELVATPEGPRRVLEARQTSPCADVYEVELSNGRLLYGTGTHPVWSVTRRQFITIDNLTTSDKLQAYASISEGSSCPGSTRKPSRMLTALSSMGSFIGAIRVRLASTYSATTRALVGAGSCIATFRNSTTARFRQGTTSITGTKTPSITTPAISSASQQRSTAPTDTPSKWKTQTPPSSATISPGFARRHPSGTAVKPVAPGMQSMGSVVGQEGPSSHAYVLSAGVRSSPSLKPQSFAATGAETETGPNVIQITRLSSAPVGKQPVYNLTVEGAHSYYANGVLTHNCDALAWVTRLMLEHAPPMNEPIRKKNEKSWKEKLKNFGRGTPLSHMAA